MCVYREWWLQGGSSWQGRRPCHHLCPLVKQAIVGSGTFKQRAHTPACCAYPSFISTLLESGPERSRGVETCVFRGKGKAGWLVREWPIGGVKGENLEVERGGRGNERRAPLKHGMKRGKRSALPRGNKFCKWRRARDGRGRRRMASRAGGNARFTNVCCAVAQLRQRLVTARVRV